MRVELTIDGDFEIELIEGGDITPDQFMAVKNGLNGEFLREFELFFDSYLERTGMETGFMPFTLTIHDVEL